MPARASLTDRAHDDNAKEKFIGKGGDLDPMLNTRQPEELLHKMRVYCAQNKITIKEFVNKAIKFAMKNNVA